MSKQLADAELKGQQKKLVMVQTLDAQQRDLQGLREELKQVRCSNDIT